jgi:hypothetical protein
MEHDGTATFRLPFPFQIGLFAVAMLGPCVDLLIDFHFSLILYPFPELITIAAWVLVWIFLIPLYTVQLRPDGIKLYSLWWLPWKQVKDVRYWKLFGLSYFRVKRHRGISLWIPLYFVGNCELGQSIIRAAPPGNPFRLVSTSP